MSQRKKPESALDRVRRLLLAHAWLWSRSSHAWGTSWTSGALALKRGQALRGRRSEAPVDGSLMTVPSLPRCVCSKIWAAWVVSPVWRANRPGLNNVGPMWVIVGFGSQIQNWRSKRWIWSTRFIYVVSMRPDFAIQKLN